LVAYLQQSCSTTVFKNRLRQLSTIQSDTEVEQFGIGIEAHESVVTALACFALYPDDYPKAVATAIWQGRDTDTIGAMTGALVGAHLGSSFADTLPLDRLEDGVDFVAFVRQLSEDLAGTID